MEKKGSVTIVSNVSLKAHTTFGIGGNAEHFAVVHTKEMLEEASQFAKDRALPIFMLGGGSNVLVADEGVEGLTIKNEITDISYDDEGDAVIVRAGAGVTFDALVAKTVQKELWGLENLSSIPGTVGATPVQNVGAYGVEVADTIEYVRVFDVENGTHTELSKEECRFGYRDSFFKTSDGKKYMVTEVAYRLSKKGDPKLSYKDLARTFTDQKPNLHEIREAVIAIRKEKFPDWRAIGTAGSFFKNPIITHEEYALLAAKYSGLPAFVLPSGDVKVPLGWILEHVLNIKGVRVGNVGTYEKQALVVVNYKNASAREIDMFAREIEQIIFDTCGITVEREVTFVS